MEGFSKLDPQKIALHTLFHEAQTLEEKDEAILRLEAGEKLMVMVQEARDTPLGLFKLCRPGLKPRDRLFIPDFYNVWNELFTYEPRFLIEYARGVGKSVFVQSAIAWAIGRNHDLRIKYLAEVDGEAFKRLQVLHGMIDNQSNIYHVVFPEVQKAKKSAKRPNGAETLNIERDLIAADHTVQARGILNMATGGRSEIIVLDDIVGYYNSIEKPAYLPKVLNKLREDWFNTLTTGSLVWCVFTPWERSDANEWLKQNVDWPHVRGAHGKPGNKYWSLFPQLFPEERLRKQEEMVGPIAYARGFLLNISSEDMDIVTPGDLRHMTSQNFDMEKALGAINILSADPAKGGKEAARTNKVSAAACALAHFHLTPRIDDPSSPKPGDATYDEDDEDLYEEGILNGHGYEVFFSDVFTHYVSSTDQPYLYWHMIIQYNVSIFLVEAEGLSDLDRWMQRTRKELYDQYQRDGQRPPEALMNCKIVAVLTKGLSKIERLNKVMDIIRPPSGDPPVVYFNHRCLPLGPQKEYLSCPGLGQIEVTRPLYNQILVPAMKMKDALDVVTQLLNWTKHNLAPVQSYAVKDDDSPTFGGFL